MTAFQFVSVRVSEKSGPDQRLSQAGLPHRPAIPRPRSRATGHPDGRAGGRSQPRGTPDFGTVPGSPRSRERGGTRVSSFRAPHRHQSGREAPSFQPQIPGHRGRHGPRTHRHRRSVRAHDTNRRPPTPPPPRCVPQRPSGDDPLFGEPSLHLTDGPRDGLEGRCTVRDSLAMNPRNRLSIVSIRQTHGVRAI